MTEDESGLAGKTLLRSVAALLVTEDKRYLMQLRDNLPTVNMAGNWGLFGGWVEPGEDFADAMVRELDEELAFQPQSVRPFTELIYRSPNLENGVIRKMFFEVPIDAADIAGMDQQEGEDKRLFSGPDLQATEKILPWDLCGIMLHVRDADIRALHKPEQGFDTSDLTA